MSTLGLGINFSSGFLSLNNQRLKPCFFLKLSRLQKLGSKKALIQGSQSVQLDSMALTCFILQKT